MLPQVCIYAQQAHTIPPRKLELFQVKLVILFAERSMRASCAHPGDLRAYARAHRAKSGAVGGSLTGLCKAHSSPIRLSVRIGERPSGKLPKPRHFSVLALLSCLPMCQPVCLFYSYPKPGRRSPRTEIAVRRYTFAHHVLPGCFSRT